MRVSFKDEIRVLMIRVYTMQAGSVSWAHYLAVAAELISEVVEIEKAPVEKEAYPPGITNRR